MNKNRNRKYKLTSYQLRYMFKAKNWVACWAYGGSAFRRLNPEE